MLFKLADINTNSRLINFIFSNDDDELVVKTRNGNMFVPNNTYDINITHELSIVTPNSYLGVVTRKTRNSARIASSSDLWIVPAHMCKFNPGIDVWIRIAPISL